MRRGLKGVQLVTSDAHQGLNQSAVSPTRSRSSIRRALRSSTVKSHVSKLLLHVVRRQPHEAVSPALRTRLVI